MLVRFIKNCGVYQAGMLLDMPENVAMLYVKRGVARSVRLKEVYKGKKTDVTDVTDVTDSGQGGIKGW